MKLSLSYARYLAVYYLMTTLHALSAAAILRIPRLPLAPRETRSAWADLVAGAHYLRGQPLLALLLALEGVRVLFLMPYQSLLPAFAQDSLGFDASGLGLLQSAIGFGGLLASLIAGHLGGLKNKGRRPSFMDVDLDTNGQVRGLF